MSNPAIFIIFAGISWCFQLFSSIPNYFPGFSFLVDDDDEIDGNDDVGVGLVRAYNYARDELDDNAESFKFLIGVS